MCEQSLTMCIDEQAMKMVQFLRKSNRRYTVNYNYLFSYLFARMFSLMTAKKLDTHCVQMCVSDNCIYYTSI